MRLDLDDVMTQMRTAGAKKEKLLENILERITPNSAQSASVEKKGTTVPRMESPPLEIPLNFNC